MTDTFNLVDEPWIVALDKYGNTREYSISEILVGADTVVSVGGELPTQQFAITRLLLAIVRRAIAWGNDPVQRWKQLWDAGVLPADEICAYLDAVRPAFDLLDSEKPFYQVPGFQTGRGGPKPVGVLISDLPPNIKYFTTRAGPGADDLSFAEAARWIVHTQCYDASGIKTGDPRDPRTKGGKGYPIGIAWAGQLGGALMEVETLTRTLLLNTVLIYNDESTVLAADLPAWERAPLTVTVRDDSTISGPLDLLTWQSRRIAIEVENGRVTGATIGNGDPTEPFNQMKNEFLTPWRYSEIQSGKSGEQRYYARTFDPDRALWRGLESLFAGVGRTDSGLTKDGIRRGLPPGVIEWISYLQGERLLGPETVIRAHVFGLRYDSNASVIGAAIDDQVRFSATLLTSNDLLARVIDAVSTAEGVGRAVGTLARDLGRAAGGDGHGDLVAETMRFLGGVERPFRNRLPVLSVENADDWTAEWQQNLVAMGTRSARDLIARAGRPAQIGRDVGDGDRSQWIDAAIAERWFYLALRRELPFGFETEESEKVDVTN